MKNLPEELQKKIKELEAKVEACRKAEGSKFELVNQKNMTPSLLKAGTAFRNWREEFERYAGLKVKGLQGVLKLIGGRKSWGDGLQGEVNNKLKSLGYEDDKEEIEEQLKVALEAYTAPASEERKIVTSQENGMNA